MAAMSDSGQYLASSAAFDRLPIEIVDEILGFVSTIEGARAPDRVVTY